MGKRLSKIYTRTGDLGETGLGDGNRIMKDAPRVHAMGSVDELNSFLGLLIEEIYAQNHAEIQQIGEFLRYSQHRIFDLGGELSIPDFRIITANHVEAVEQHLDELNSELAPLENFILPGGSRLIATFHLARSICRRAERDLVTLSAETEINADGLKYLNRLSDYLFVAARYAAKSQDVEEVLWEKDQA
jgi:cob(I)alamin adenosyltransferase